MEEAQPPEEQTGASPSGDGAIAWRALGAGPPLLLINGYAGAKADWDPAFLANLATRRRVICPDNRGIGESPRGGEPITVEQLAADMLALLDDLGIDRLPVAGWSMGGFVTQTLAAAHPERVEATILIGTHPGGAITVNAERGIFPALIDHSGTPREQARRLIGLLFPEPMASQVDAQFGELVADARAALDPATLLAQEDLMRAWHKDPSEERLATLAASGMPLLCAHGAEDVVVPAANSDRIAAAIPGSWKAIFPGAGHAVMSSEPARLAAVIHTFLAE